MIMIELKNFFYPHDTIRYSLYEIKQLWDNYFNKYSIIAPSLILVFKEVDDKLSPNYLLIKVSSKEELQQIESEILSELTLSPKPY